VFRLYSHTLKIALKYLVVPSFCIHEFVLDSSYIYAPYMSICTTPCVFDLKYDKDYDVLANKMHGKIGVVPKPSSSSSETETSSGYSFGPVLSCFYKVGLEDNDRLLKYYRTKDEQQHI